MMNLKKIKILFIAVAFCGQFLSSMEIPLLLNDNDLKNVFDDILKDSKVCRFDECNLSFWDEKDQVFYDHVVTHISDRNWKCKWVGCTYVTSNKSSKIRHLRTHTGEKPFKCKDCGQLFNDQSSKRKHEHSHLNNETESEKDDDVKKIVFTCTQCSDVFSKKRLLTIHMQKTHVDKKKFQCMFDEDECSHGTNDRYKLGQHIISQHLKKIKKQKRIFSWREYQAETIKELAQRIMDDFYPSKRGNNQYKK